MYSDVPIFEQHLSSARICSCSEAAAWCSHASISPRYLSGSCECSSMGRGVPAGPPRVSASMKQRTTAARRAVANSSSAYLHRQQNNNLNVIIIIIIISSVGSMPLTEHCTRSHYLTLNTQIIFPTSAQDPKHPHSRWLCWLKCWW